MNAHDIEAARQELVSRFPNFGTLLSFFKGRYVAVPGKGTIAVDRHMRVYYGPELNWTPDEILGALEHELGHICRNHFQRAEQLESETGKKVNYGRWNVAGDLEINDDLVFQLPAGYGVVPGVGTFSSLSPGGIAEGYYGWLGPKTDPAPKPPPEPEPEPEQDEGQEQQPGGDPGDGDPGADEGEGESEAGSGPGDDEGADEGDGGAEGDAGQEEGPEAGSEDSGADAEAEGEGSGADGQGQGEEQDGGQGQSEGGQAEGEGSDGGAGGNGGQQGEGETGAEAAGGGDGEGEGAEVYDGHEGDCGSCSGGPPRADELPVDDPMYPGVTPEQVERAVEEAKKATGKAMADPDTEEGQALNRPGKGSGIANSVFGPMVGQCYEHTWESVLHREISRYLKTGGRSYQRPSRRLYDRKVIHIGKGKVPPSIAIVVDVSGSIDEASAEKAFAIVNKFKGWDIKFRVVACDDEAQEVKPGQHGYAGGGTEMMEGIKYVSRHFGKVDACFVITDGGDYWHAKEEEKPGFPVVVFTWMYDGPSWVRTVRMPPLDETQAATNRGIKGGTYNKIARGYDE